MVSLKVVIFYGLLVFKEEHATENVFRTVLTCVTKWRAELAGEETADVGGDPDWRGRGGGYYTSGTGNDSPEGLLEPPSDSWSFGQFFLRRALQPVTWGHWTLGKKLKTRLGKTVACGFLPGWSLEPRSPVRAGGWLGLEAAPPPLSRPRRVSLRRDAQDRAAPPDWPAGVRHTSPSHNNPLVRRLYDNVQFIKGQRFRDTFGRNPARPPSPEWEAGFNSWDEEELTILALTPHCFPQSL